jgi:hypothetical protein
MYHMFESQAHLAVWTALLFYVSFAWRKKQAVESDPMQTSAGWLAGEFISPCNGRAWRETDMEATDLEIVITDLLAGQ